MVVSFNDAAKRIAERNKARDDLFPPEYKRNPWADGIDFLCPYLPPAIVVEFKKEV